MPRDLWGVDVSQLEHLPSNNFQRGVYYLYGHRKKTKCNVIYFPLEAERPPEFIYVQKLKPGRGPEPSVQNTI